MASPVVNVLYRFCSLTRCVLSSTATMSVEKRSLKSCTVSVMPQTSGLLYLAGSVPLKKVYRRLSILISCVMTDAFCKVCASSPSSVPRETNDQIFLRPQLSRDYHCRPSVKVILSSERKEKAGDPRVVMIVSMSSPVWRHVVCARGKAVQSMSWEASKRPTCRQL